MSWKDTYQRGSFRGVEFFLESHSASDGRRIATYEYALSEGWSTRDYGKRPREFSLSCYLAGENYHLDRDRLVRVLSMKGEGNLIHPYLGSISARVRSFSFTETRTEGGFVKFSIQFVESRPINNPRATTDDSANLNSQTLKSFSNLLDAFTSNYSGDISSPRLENSTKNTLQQFVGDIENQASAFLQDEDASYSNFAFSVKELKRNSDNLSLFLVRGPGRMGFSVQNIIRDVVAVVKQPFETILSLSSFFQTGSKYAPPISENNSSLPPSRVREVANERELNAFIRRNSILAASQAAPLVEASDGVSAAVQARSILIGAIDREALTTSTEELELYEELRSIKASLVNILPSQAEVETRTFTVTRTLPSLVLAYQIYGNIDNEQDLIDRNGIEKPMFVEAPSVIEVASDA